MSKEEYSLHILKKVVIDGFLFCGLTLCILGIEFFWQPFQRGFFCGDESLMFPYKDDTITASVLKLVGLGLPVITIIICEWVLLRRSGETPRCLGVRIPTWVQGVYCGCVSLFLGYCFVELTANIAKNVIGRPRPHFFDLCQPSVDCAAAEWRDRYIQATDYYCTGSQSEKFTDMRRSFLSGHSAISAYTMLFLAFYLEKRMCWSGTRVLRHSLQFVVVMLSWFCALSRISDFKHHWSDVLAGYTLGAVVAVLVWNYCTDLIPKKHAALPQHDVATIHLSSQQIALGSA